MKHSTTIVPGSIFDVAKQEGVGIAEVFINAVAVVIADISSSMNASDFDQEYGSRYEQLMRELNKLQQDIPGKIALIAFNDTAQFVASGVLPPARGTTDLAAGLRFAQAADGTGIRFIVISDGEPDSERAALDLAGQFSDRIDTIYIGPKGGPGQAFLDRLSRASKTPGSHLQTIEIHKLTQTVKGLLTG